VFDTHSRRSSAILAPRIAQVSRYLITMPSNFIPNTKGYDEARANDPRSEESKTKDLISRGDYTPTPVGKFVFVILRAIDPFIQYSILHGAGTGLLHQIGLRTLPLGIPANTGISIIDGLGLSPYRLVLVAMAVGSALKQGIWAVTLSGEPMNVNNAIAISIFNTVFNSVNSYAFLLRAASASLESDFPQPALLVGGLLYVTGLLTELISEVQRKRFKMDPKNKGKPYTGGLWSFARHINYGGYTIWRAYALAGGGWILGALVGAFFFSDFARRGVPVLNE
jgi:protein-S-isoprenylcysteine O-methyltransferase Ste14